MHVDPGDQVIPGQDKTRKPIPLQLIHTQSQSFWSAESLSALGIQDPDPDPGGPK